MLASGALTFGAFAALGLGACGGGGGDADVGATLTTLTTVAPADTPAPTTAVQTTAAQPMPTAPPPAEGELELTDSLRAEIIAAFDESRRAFLDALYDPIDPMHPGIDATRLRDTASNTRLLLRDLQARGWAGRPSEQDLEMTRVLSVGLSATDAAELRACVLSDAVIFEVASGAVINDVVETATYNVDMQLDDGRWKVLRSTKDASYEGVASCDGF